ncbi:MAG: SDR family NAD(P)-dependent oxidoreductase, partial [Bacteroidota bacterium]
MKEEQNKQARITPKFDLSGKVAIITGASKGIGESIARGFAEFGAQVVISSRKQEAVDQVAESFRADGLDAVGVACHVGIDEQLQALIDATVKQYGGVDIIVNNAATNPVYGPINEAQGEVFDKIFGVNVKAPFLLSNLAYPIMKARGGGSIIHISSVE